MRHLPIILMVLGLMACIAGAIHGVSQLAGLLMFGFGALLFLAPRDGEAKWLSASGSPARQAS